MIVEINAQFFLFYSRWCLSISSKSSIQQIDSVVIFQENPESERRKKTTGILKLIYIYIHTCMYFFRSLKQREYGYRSRDTNPISYRHYAAAYKNRTVVERIRGINLDHGFFSPFFIFFFFLFLPFVCLFRLFYFCIFFPSLVDHAN